MADNNPSIIVFDGVCAICRFIRDPLYRWIARHRYRLFGRREACRVPTADIADRFLH
jgi:predicted DCC family thiol-disulfide oxidoreductase YuxK